MIKIIKIEGGPDFIRFFPSWLKSEEQIKKVEHYYNASWVGTIDCKDLFWVETPDKSKGHSNYFVFYRKDSIGLNGSITIGDFYIANGIPFLPKDNIFHAIRVKDSNEILISTHVHDFHSDVSGNVLIDGGQEYLRVVGEPSSWERVSLKLEHGKWSIL